VRKQSANSRFPASVTQTVRSAATRRENQVGLDVIVSVAKAIALQDKSQRQQSPTPT
jgi:hypothetical protein